MEEKQAQLEILKYQALGFNNEQLIEIKNGLLDDIDVATYARLDISADDMNHIRRSLFYETKHPHETHVDQQIIPVETEEEIEEKKKEQRDKSNRELAEIALVFGTIAIIASILFIVRFFNV